MTPSSPHAQRLPAEMTLAEELTALKEADSGPKPEGWQLSPRAVRRFILGNQPDSQEQGQPTIKRKVFGNDAVVERSIVTLAGQRGLMLVGEPGTAKSMLSELLAAAIGGDSTLTVQGGAGIVEEQIRYSWNYALLLRDGPSQEALVSGPLHRAMSHGKLMRFEEISRCATEVQDCLVPVLSERLLHIPELKSDTPWLAAQPGFNVIATANLHDRGVNEMSAALKRRFNFETMQPLQGIEAQARLIQQEASLQLQQQQIGIEIQPDVIQILATAFQELREGKVAGTTSIDKPGTVMSMAEAISVVCNAATECWYFGEPSLQPRHLSRYLIGTVIKDNEDDRKRFQDYLRLVGSRRSNSDAWQDFVQGGKHA